MSIPYRGTYGHSGFRSCRNRSRSLVRLFVDRPFVDTLTRIVATGLRSRWDYRQVTLVSTNFASRCFNHVRARCTCWSNNSATNCVSISPHPDLCVISYLRQFTNSVSLIEVLLFLFQLCVCSPKLRKVRPGRDQLLFSLRYRRPQPSSHAKL